MKTLRRALGIIAALVVLGFSNIAISQTTDSCPPQQLPWSTSFEVDHGGLQCWSIIDEHAGYPMVYEYGFAHNGQGALALLSEGDSTPCTIATPLLAYRADSLHIGFWLTANSGEGTLQVGMWDTVFHPILTIDLTTAENGYYDFYTDGFESSDTMSLAFRVINGRIGIDDISVEVASSCRIPCSVSLTNIGIYAAEAVWNTCGSTALFYVVRLVDILLEDTVTMLASDTMIYIGGLQPGTYYRLEVAALCDSDTIGWVSTYFTTEVTCRIPKNVAVETITASSVGLSWEYDTNGINQPTGVSVLLENLNTNEFGDWVQTTSTFIFFDSLNTGHRYRAHLRTICSSDTSNSVSVDFFPMGDACITHQGDGVNSNYPINCMRRYSYSQTLYPGSIVAGLDSIHAIALRTVSDVVDLHRSIDLYIGFTDSTSLLENVSSMFMWNVVQDYTIGESSDGWIIIPFDYPLAADTSDNLIVTIVDHTGTQTGVIRFGNHIEPYGGILYGSSNEVPFDPSMFNMQLFSASTVPDIQLFGNCDLAPCQPPAAMVTATTANSISISWIAESDTCIVAYRSDGGQWSYSAPLTGTNFTLSSLNPSSRYTLLVGSVCGSEIVYGNEMEAFTSCGIVDVPYSVDFAEEVNSCWQGHQIKTSSGIRIGDMIISPEIGQDVNTLQVRMLIGDVGGIIVGVCDAGGENIQWIDTAYNTTSEPFAECYVYLDTYTGSSRRIAFKGTNNMSVLSEVNIEPLDDCLPPRSLSITNITSNHASLSWQGDALYYEVHLHESATDCWSEWQTQSNSITLSGLSGDTYYDGYVLSYCAGGNSIHTLFEFTTDCGTITYFPYIEGFENIQPPAQCWTMIDTDPGHHNPMTHSNVCSYSGQRSFRFSSFNYVESDNYDQYLISPRIEADDSIWLEFSYTKSNIDHEPFAVGYSIFDNSIEDFIWLPTVEPEVGSWQRYRVGLSPATRYVAIHYQGENNYYLYIDDLTILGPGCNSPVVTMIDEQVNSVSIGWAGDSDTSYVAITDGIWLSNVEGIAVTGNEYTFSELESGVFYTIGIRYRCSDGHFSDWTTRRVATINSSCQPPVDIAFDDIDYSSVSVSWTPIADEHQWQMNLLADDILVAQYTVLNTPQTVITDLNQGQEYSLLVRSVCSSIPGPWSDTISFVTLECMPVSDLDYERIDFRTISLSWTDDSISTGHHRVEYGEHGFELGTGPFIEADGMPIVIDGLEPEIEYDFYVFNYCRPDVPSASATMITVPPALAIDGVEMQTNLLSLYPNPATSYVLVDGLESGALLQVMDLSGRTLDIFRTNDNPLQIDLSRYPAGTYYMRATMPTHTAVGKVVVSR